MRYRVGDLLVPRTPNKYGTVVWDDSMSDAIGHIADTDVVTVVKSEDDYGWVYVLTCEGITGVVHRTNLMMIPQTIK